MSESDNQQLTGEPTLDPAEFKRSLAAKNTYAKKRLAPQRVAPKPAAAAPDDTANFAQAMQSLFSLVGMMRTITADSTQTPLSPKLVLSGNGVEVRFTSPNGAVESVPAEVSTSPDQMLRIERSLKVLGLRMAKVEGKESAASEDVLSRIEKELKEVRQAQIALANSVSQIETRLGSQSEVVETLRASVRQNEEMMETLVDSMNMVDELGDGGFGPELLIPPDTLAS